ncbi:MAG: glycosyltransferase [Candidatus Dependentiae bacterium]
MRIAMVSNNYTPYSGGVVSSLNAIVPQLQALGHEVIIVTLDFTGDHCDPDYVIRIKTCLKFLYKNNHMALPWRLHQQLQQILINYNPDIIHIHHPFLLGAAAVRIAKKLQKKVIFTHHTLYHAYAHYIPFAPIALTQKCINALVTSLCNKVDGIVIPTFDVMQFLIPAIHYKTIVLPSPLQSHFLNNQFIPKNKESKFRLLTIGRMVPEKNVKWLLEMFTGLNPELFEFTLVGYGSSYNELQTYAYDLLKLSSTTVKFVHKPDKELLKLFYRNADLFIFASQTDTQALVLAESMAFGTPVIALDGVGQRHIVEQGYNGYLVHSHHEMRLLIQALANDADHHMYLQKNAFQTSLGYHPAVLAEKLITFYLKTGCNTVC